jgi:hypothetical protein
MAVAVVFTEQAIFQGLHPYSMGRHGVAEYYASQPSGMTAEYTIQETRCLAPDLVLGYLTVAWRRRPRRPVRYAPSARPWGRVVGGGLRSWPRRAPIAAPMSGTNHNGKAPSPAPLTLSSK